jgi:hypothetical protein
MRAERICALSACLSGIDTALKFTACSALRATMHERPVTAALVISSKADGNIRPKDMICAIRGIGGDGRAKST